MADRPSPTSKQQQTLDDMRRHLVEHGHAPTLQWLADEAGVSKVAMLERVRALIGKGYVHHRVKRRPAFQLADESLGDAVAAVVAAHAQADDMTEAVQRLQLEWTRFSRTAVPHG